MNRDERAVFRESNDTVENNNCFRQKNIKFVEIKKIYI